MLEFLSINWVWILLIGGMLFMHRGHGSGHGGHGGCGGHQHSGTDHEQADDEHRSHQPDHERLR